jgi:hypothetical protein
VDIGRCGGSDDCHRAWIREFSPVGACSAGRSPTRGNDPPTVLYECVDEARKPSARTDVYGGSGANHATFCRRPSQAHRQPGHPPDVFRLRGSYGLHRKWLHKARHVLTPRAFIHQTHLATMLGLLVCSFAAFLATHFGNSLVDAGNGIADIGSSVISPLAFDSEQYLKTLTTYGPLTQSKKVVDDIAHITSGLHIIAAQSFIVLLVLFEIVKESFIKPVLKEGVSEFRHVPAPAPAKKSENKDNQVQPQNTATERLRVSNPASTGPAAGNGSDAATTTVPKDAKGAATAGGPEAPQ